LDRLVVFHGVASPAAARVYAAWAGPPADYDHALRGFVRGPFCRWARTLPARAELRPGQSRQGPLAEALLTDPCFWCDELPLRYEVRVELTRGGQVVAVVDRWLGIRAVGGRGKNLVRAGRRWAVRGIGRDRVRPSPPLESWRDGAAALYAFQPDDLLCRQASEAGVYLLAELDGPGGATVERIARLAQWPAVAFLVLAAGTPVGELERFAAANVVLAERFDAGQAVRPSAWARAAVVDVAAAGDFAAAVQDVTLPVIARRPLPQPAPLAVARRACDDLQRELARYGDFAGYVV
jgi:hypothetical protein